MGILITISGLDKIVNRKIGDDYIVGKMIKDRDIYRIFINDMEGVHKRDLKLRRHPTPKNPGIYRLEYGSSYELLSKPEISDLNAFIIAIETLLY